MLFLFYVTVWFILRGASCLVLPCSLSSCFFSPFSIVTTSLGEEGAGLCGSHACVGLFYTHYFVSFFSSSWRQGLTASSDCVTPWTVLLTFFGVYRTSPLSSLEVKVMNLEILFLFICLYQNSQ